MKRKAGLQQAIVLCCGLLICTGLWLSPAPVQADDAVTPQSFILQIQADDVDRNMWSKLTPEDQSRVLHYYGLGKQSGLTNEQLKSLGYRVLSYFYYIQASINYINNPTGEYKGGPGKRVLGKQIEKLILQVGTIFSDKGKQLDDAIKRIMTEELKNKQEELKNKQQQLKDKQEELRKKNETLKILNETLEILKQIQKSF